MAKQTSKVKTNEIKAELSAKLNNAIKLLEEKVIREFNLPNLVGKTLIIKSGEISIK